MKHYNITVAGSIYAVGYRKFVREIANQTGVHGYVMYKSDKAVYIEAEGSPDDLSNFIESCKKGTVFTRIEKFSFEESKTKNYKYFKIMRSQQTLNYTRRIINFLKK